MSESSQLLVYPGRLESQRVMVERPAYAYSLVIGQAVYQDCPDQQSASGPKRRFGFPAERPQALMFQQQRGRRRPAHHFHLPEP